MTSSFLAANQSPEVVLKQTFGKPMDIWSVGCVVVLMVTGKVSYTQTYASTYMPI